MVDEGNGKPEIVQFTSKSAKNLKKLSKSSKKQSSIIQPLELISSQSEYDDSIKECDLNPELIKASSSFYSLNGTQEVMLDVACGDHTEDSNVLIVDDNVFNMIAIQGIVLQFGLSSDKANNGAIAQRMVRERF